MKNKKILIILIIAIIMILFGATRAQATLELEEWNFDAQINSDGSMDVTETWNIYVSDTNTLFKTFKRDSSKYTEITNVTVKDITEGREFFQIYEEMYHVTENCYYALNNSNGLFEIAWGTGMENDSDTKIYEISYKVKDAIAKYNDYAELYWQFVGEDFEIDADKINGRIILPFNAQNKEEIKVWGHTEDLNGEIYATDLNKIEFEINEYSSGNYVEVRTLFPKNMIETTKRTYNISILNSVIQEETKWAQEANERRERVEFIKKIVLTVLTVVTIIYVIKIFLNISKLRKYEKKIKTTTKLQYFRELPYEDATPTEALFVISKGMPANFAASFSASILDLCLKKYLTLEAKKEGTFAKKDVVTITFLEKDTSELKEDEKLILDFLKQIAGNENSLTTKDITKYLKAHLSKIEILNKKLNEIIEEVEEENNNFSKEKMKEYNKFVVICIIYIMFVFLGLGLFIPLGIVWLINGIICGMIAGRINVFTQKGVDEREQWKAFKKYMEDFSLLKEKEIPALVVWEKYLVFATAFGISEKVLKQLKVVYPEMSDLSSTMYTYSYIGIMNSVDLGNCINSSVYSAIGSSGNGAGGGFSGGGGGGRWPEEAVADAKL